MVFDHRKYPTIGDSLRKIKELGFNAVDLDALENWQHVNPSDLAAGNTAWVQDALQWVTKLDLRVSSVNSSLSRRFTDPDPSAFLSCKREFVAVLDLAEAVGSPNVTLQPGPVFETIGKAGSLKILRERLQELSELRARYKTSVSLEGHDNTVIEDPETALDLIASFWPDFGYTYDPSHYIMNCIDLRRTEALLDYTVHVHVRNASHGKMQDTMADGSVDIEWLVSALKAHGYESALAIEYFWDFDSDFKNTQALRARLIELGVEI